MREPSAAVVVDYRLRMAAAAARVRQALIAYQVPGMPRSVDELLLDALAELEAPPLRDDAEKPKPRRRRGSAAKRPRTINERDLAVLRALSEGHTYASAAEALGYRSKTSIYRRVNIAAALLGVDPHSDLVVAAAVDRGWI